MCDSMSCACSVIESGSDDAGNEFPSEESQIHKYVSGTLRNREAKTQKLPIQAWKRALESESEY